MNNIPSAMQTNSPAPLNNYSPHASLYELSKMIHDEESCFGTDNRYACARANCAWRGACTETTSIWLR